LQCSCGLTEQGYSFCPRVYSDQHTTNLRKVTENLSQIHDCHSVDRHDIYECLILNVASQHELQLLDSYIRTHYEYTSANLVRWSPPCVKRHSQVSQYWEALENRTLNGNLHKLTREAGAKKLEQNSFYGLCAFLLAIYYMSFKS